MKKVFLLIVFMVMMFSLKSQMTFQRENVTLLFSFDSISSTIHLLLTNLSDKIMYLNARQARYDKIENDFFNGYHSCICISSAGVSLARPQEGTPMEFYRLSKDSTIQIDIVYHGYYASKKIKSSVFKLLFTLEYLLLSEDQYIEDMMRNEDLMEYLKEHQYKIHKIEIEDTMSFE